ncbi:rubrerythrin family protein [Methanocaldococcus sp.]|uniref:rubrerythrin family protein n=1 Tax=Methanocaldococcus sp. TaxID=2152917 RepID=UPI00262F4804|nr:rubrerythrin family protein [Methanocaldococcus sp.]MCQ6253644.1 rubrerythrin family protein [Methanocaldococcus sp.]
MKQTLINLIKAYIGESLARNRYTCYAKIAKNEGYEIISDIFLLTAENLKASIEGEHYEYTEMYPKFAEIAEKEGLKDIAERLRAIAIAEKHHEERFKKLLKELENGTLYKKNENIEWVCKKCGYVHVGNEPPEECPSCSHPRKYFMVKCEKY